MWFNNYIDWQYVVKFLSVDCVWSFAGNNIKWTTDKQKDIVVRVEEVILAQ
jgi:hypothetical protein